jgi:CRISPR-associated endonuclease/helicase Cas3
MKIILKPLYSKLNPGVQGCPLGCQSTCKVKPYLSCNSECPLSSHQAETYKHITQSDADIIFNTSATGDGKSLAAYLPGLLDSQFRTMGLYPTIELVEDQTRQQKEYHIRFDRDPLYRIDRIYGVELSRRLKEQETDRFNLLLQSIEQKPVILTNPDIFHFITHFRYRNPAKSSETLPFALADFPDLWVFDEFHIFGCHQETAVLNSMTLIRQATQRKKKFLFTSATPREDFIQQLKQAGFKVVEVKGKYSSEDKPGYRQILQKVELEFVYLKDTDTLNWLSNNIALIHNSLEAETKGRGLIIINSVALASKVVTKLQELLPDVIVREISGRCDRHEKDETRKLLVNEDKPVLVVGTSAVDVGVDFKIHLLICEGSDSATVIQRLGRLGRHAGFNNYRAYVLVANHIPWIMSRLEEKIKKSDIKRSHLTEAIEYAFNPPQQFTQYRHQWGALQARGMLAEMMRENPKVMKLTSDRVNEDLGRVYGDKLESARKYWYKLSQQKNEADKAIQQEILRFRGGSTLQAAVWNGERFYQYDLLRILPYALVEIVDRDTYITAATKHNHIAEEFDDKYIDVYVRVTEWLEKRQPIEILCNRYSHKLEVGNLFLCDRLNVTGHPQSEVANCLNGKKLLCFLIYLGKKSQWDVAQILKLSPLFGLYRLTDGSGNIYACAFNQDAMLLEALKFNLPKKFRDRPNSIIF